LLSKSIPATGSNSNVCTSCCTTYCGSTRPCYGLLQWTPVARIHAWASLDVHKAILPSV